MFTFLCLFRLPSNMYFQMFKLEPLNVSTRLCIYPSTEVQIDGRPRRLSFFPGDKVVRYTGPYGRPSFLLLWRYFLQTTIKL